MTKKDYNYLSQNKAFTQVSFTLSGTCTEVEMLAQQVVTCLFADPEKDTLRLYGGGLVRELAEINNDAGVIENLISSIVNTLCYDLINIYNKTELLSIHVDSVESDADDAIIQLTIQTTYGTATAVVSV